MKKGIEKVVKMIENKQQKSGDSFASTFHMPHLVHYKMDSRVMSFHISFHFCISYIRF